MSSLGLSCPTRIRDSSGWRFPWLCCPIHPVSDQHSIGSWDDDDDRPPLIPEFVAACPRLTELTVVFHHQYDAKHAEMGILLDPAGGARSAMSELVVACKALPDFDILQVVRVTINPVHLVCWCGWGGCGSRMDSSEQQEQILRKQTEDMKDWAMDCLKKPKTGRQEEKERRRKRTTLRVFMFGPGRPCHTSGKVGEYEV